MKRTKRTAERSKFVGAPSRNKFWEPLVENDEFWGLQPAIIFAVAIIGE